MEEQQLENISVKQAGMKWGLILGVILIALSLIIQMAGLMGNKLVGFISYAFIIGAIYMSHKAYKEGGDGYMSYGKGLGLSLLVLSIGSIISSLFMYINMKFIDETIMTTIIDNQYNEMAEKGMSEETIEKTMEMTSAFMTPEFILIAGIIGTIIIGFIISLIVTAITKNTNPNEDF